MKVWRLFLVVLFTVSVGALAGCREAEQSEDKDTGFEDSFAETEPAGEESDSPESTDPAVIDPPAPADKAKATHKKVGALGKAAETTIRDLESFCLMGDDKMLLCDAASKKVKVVDLQDKLLATWDVGLAPEAVCVAPDGGVFVGGPGKVKKLDSDGKELKALDKIEGTAFRDVAGICATADNVFMTIRGGSGYSVVKTDLDLGNPKVIMTKLRGCCGQMDISACGEGFAVAENSNKKVRIFDANGKQTEKWGSGDRNKVDGFGSCCGPMNLRVVGNHVYTSESTNPGKVKIFTLSGEYHSLVGEDKGPGACVRVTVDASPDHNRMFVLDGTKNQVLVFERQG